MNVTSDVNLPHVPEARNLGVLFHPNSYLSGHISSITKSCFLILGVLGILDLFLIKLQLVILQLLLSILNLTTITLFLNLPANQLDHLQLVLTSAVRAVTKTPRFHLRTPILNALHSLKISQRIHCKILCITYKCFISNKPTYVICLLFKLPPPPVLRLSLLLYALTILLVFKLPINPSVILLLFCGMFYLRNFISKFW
jgi:hypothetical protein